MNRWVRKTVIFADVQYCIYADIVGGSEKVQNYADVIYGWSLTQQYNITVTVTAGLHFVKINYLVVQM